MTDETTDIAKLVSELGSDDWLARSRARDSLAAMGKVAVAPVCEALSAPDARTRWEAAKVLSVLAGREAIEPLIRALEDDDGAVRWLAAEALVRIGPASVIPVLRRLVAGEDTAWLREGAHHVLKSLVTPDTSNVVHALEGRFQSLSVPVAANEALEKLE